MSPLASVINAAMKFFGNRAAVWSLVVGLIVGILVGWAPLSWMRPLFEWTDAAPVDLSTRFGYQQQYLALLAEYHALNPTADLTPLLAERWVPAEAAKTVRAMIAKPGMAYSDPARLQALAEVLQTMPKPPVTQAGGVSWSVCLTSLLVLVVLVVGVVWVLPRFRSQGGMGLQEPKVKVAVPSTGTSGKVVQPEVWTGVSEKPVSQFITTFEVGDNRYDMSFSIESGPDFLGECGVAISETIGVGAPDKVTALEVWLFDKNDIRTITKVLMSDYCYDDPALRSKLAPKGEAVRIAPDGSIELDTQTLKLRARVIDLAYGSGGLGPNSFFDKVTLELAAWPKRA